MTQEFITPTKDRDTVIARAMKFAAAAWPGKRLRITVERYVRERTNRQCRWLNGVAYKLLGNAIGYDRDDVSEFCCGTYWGWKTAKCPKTPNNPAGIKDVPVRTTTRDPNGKRCVMSTLEFDDYKGFVQRFGAKHGIDIPDPSEQDSE